MLLIMRSRKAERKPLSFSTTMRNPNRIVSFLNCLLPYENQILTHDVLMKVVHNAIKEKLYTPVVVNRTPDLVYILRNEDEKYSDKLYLIIVCHSLKFRLWHTIIKYNICYIFSSIFNISICIERIIFLKCYCCVLSARIFVSIINS